MAMPFIDNVLFLNINQGVAISEVYNNSRGGEMLKLNVRGSSVNVSVEGRFDPGDDTWETIFAISSSQAALTTGSITSEGHYDVGVPGYRYIRVVNNGTPGSVRVYAEVL